MRKKRQSVNLMYRSARKKKLSFHVCPKWKLTFRFCVVLSPLPKRRISFEDGSSANNNHNEDECILCEEGFNALCMKDYKQNDN